MDIIPSGGMRRVPHVRLAFFLTAIIVIGLGLLAIPNVEWFLLKRVLRQRFPGIQWISTRDLADWLAQNQAAPVLLDVRTEAEWNVSHVPGARRVEPGSTAQEAAADLSHQTPIVTYCAVGFRSGQFAERLRAAGFLQVQNLEGSIFQWANEHRPLIRDSQPVSVVHPYDKFWGRLVNREARAPLSAHEL